jgi:hypothetical protein
MKSIPALKLLIVALSISTSASAQEKAVNYDDQVASILSPSVELVMATASKNLD